MKPKKKHALLVPIPQKPQGPKDVLVPKKIRHRRVFHFTLSDDAYVALKKLAGRFREPMSRTLDRLILAVSEQLDTEKARPQAVRDVAVAIRQIPQTIERRSNGKAKPREPRKMILVSK